MKWKIKYVPSTSILFFSFFFFIKGALDIIPNFYKKKIRIVYH